MTEKTKLIMQMIAARNSVTVEHVEKEIRMAIRTAMATTDPHAQALWRQIAPDGKEPGLDTFLEFAFNMVTTEMEKQAPERGAQGIVS